MVRENDSSIQRTFSTETPYVEVSDKAQNRSSASAVSPGGYVLPRIPALASPRGTDTRALADISDAIAYVFDGKSGDHGIMVLPLTHPEDDFGRPARCRLRDDSLHVAPESPVAAVVLADVLPACALGPEMVAARARFEDVDGAIDDDPGRAAVFDDLHRSLLAPVPGARLRVCADRF